MFLNEDFVAIVKMLLPGVMALLLALKWVHFRMFKSSHPKATIQFRLITAYPKREVLATGSNNKRFFMINSNRILYVLLLLVGIEVLLVVIPHLA